jgi:hypothetical protein
MGACYCWSTLEVLSSRRIKAPSVLVKEKEQGSHEIAFALYVGAGDETTDRGQGCVIRYIERDKRRRCWCRTEELYISGSSEKYVNGIRQSCRGVVVDQHQRREFLHGVGIGLSGCIVADEKHDSWNACY